MNSDPVCYTDFMEKLSQKWGVIAPLVDLDVGYEFDVGNWPLHVTIAPTHFADWRSQDFIEQFTKTVEQSRPFTVSTLVEGELGPSEHPTKVIFVNKSDELSHLHGKIVDLIYAHGGVFNNAEWNYEGFIPHVTIQKGEMVSENEDIFIDRLALVDLFPGHDGNRRKVVMVVEMRKRM